MGRDNYSYKKYQKELARKKKAEKKKQRKLDKKAMEAVPEPGQARSQHFDHEQWVAFGALVEQWGQRSIQRPAGHVLGQPQRRRFA